MRFQDIIGQQTACAQLQRAYSGGRLSHAYIFDGPEGVGKGAAAQALASLLLCAHPQGGDACGVCPACRQVAAGTHPDCHRIVPEGRGIRIRQIRDLRARLADTAVYGGYTVVIMEQADGMSIEAANAFLKTVEEPQGPTCFILLTTQAERLPDTIRSRTQRVRFRPLSSASLARLLGPAADTAEGRIAIDLAAGSLTRAQQVLQDSELRDARLRQRDELEALLGQLTTSHDGALLRFADAFAGDRLRTREEVLLIRRHYERRLRQALRDGTDLAPIVQVLHDTTTALTRLETNVEPSFILGALLIEMARHSRQ